MSNLADRAPNAEGVIAALGLAPDPEGGHDREAWRGWPERGGGGGGTAIHVLLDAAERSRRHRVGAAECRPWQGGRPLPLSLSGDGRRTDREMRLVVRCRRLVHRRRLNRPTGKSPVRRFSRPMFAPRVGIAAPRPDPGAGKATIGVVPPGWWQVARPVGGRRCLVACTVSPAFDFAPFQFASPGRAPGR